MSEATSAAAWIEANWRLDLSLAEWWRLLFDAGYAFPTWPKGLGGFDASAAEGREVSLTLASAGVIAPPSGNGPNMGGPTVIHHGTAEQRQRFVAPMGRGEVQWCQLFSEPGAGSDLASLATKAERDGDEFVITGQKVWNSSADVSEWGMLLCRTDPDQPKHRGISFMMIDMRQPGVEVRPLVQMNGDADFCEVFLTEARAKVDDVIGEIDDGWNVAKSTLAAERASAAAGRGRGLTVVPAGTMEGHLDRPVGELIEELRAAPPRRAQVLLNARSMISLARTTGAVDEPTRRDQLMRFYVHSEVYRFNGQRMRDLARARQSCQLDGSTAKLDLAMLAHESRDVSLSLLGAEGLIVGASATDPQVQHTALSAFKPSFGGGTNEIQRNIIGERTLALPREPTVDADVPFSQLKRW